MEFNSGFKGLIMFTIIIGVYCVRRAERINAFWRRNIKIGWDKDQRCISYN